nr:acyltransferase [uncultured Tolumonas sp.]
MNTLEKIKFHIRNKIKMQNNNSMHIGKNNRITNCRINIKGERNKLIIGDDTKIRNVFFEIIGNDCTIEIGNDCLIGENSYISARENFITIKIGNDCGLSRNVKIMTSDGHDIVRDDIRINQAKSIKLEDKVWVADNVTILKGVNIGSHSVVGINSTVTRSIGCHQIAVGCPAKIVAENISWRSELTY